MAAETASQLSCPNCGYVMTSLATASACPECGFAKPESGWPAAQPLLKRLGPAAFLGIWAAVLPPLGSIALFTAMGTTNIGPWMKSHGLTGAAAYAFAFTILAGCALLPTYAQSALGGYAFGITIGAPAALLGFAGGAIIGYEIAARASGDRVMAIINEKPKWRAVRDALIGARVGGGPVEITPGFWRTFGMVTLLRLPPNSPFALTNVVMASVKVPRVPFILGTIIGMAPRSTLAVMIGAGVKEFSKQGLSEAAPKWVLGVGIGAAILVVLLVGHLANRAIARATAVPAA